MTAEAVDHTPSSWQPVDLTQAVAGGEVPAPSVLKRTDDVPLLYQERVHWIQGESESLKSWLAQLAVAQLLLASEFYAVLYVDFEDDENGVISRLRALGVPTEALLDPKRFQYIRPDEPLYDKYGTALPGAVDLGFLLDDYPWIDLAVIDGVTEAMTVEGLNLIDNADIARWMRRLPRLLADCGAAVVCIDHLTKNRETQGRYALGGQHKLAGVTGAVYKITSTRRLSRAEQEPVTGTSTITVEKDRPGWVRACADQDRIGDLEVTAWPDGGITARIVPPGEATTVPPWSLVEAICAVLDMYEGAAKSQLERDVGSRAETVRAATAWLVKEGWVDVQRVGTAHRHYLTVKGRDEWKAGTR